jgi:pre-mRNA-splicing factor 18
MDKFTFSSQLKSLKDQIKTNKNNLNTKLNEQQTYIKNSDLIKNKLQENNKNNKRSSQVYNTFEELEKEKSEWNKLRNIHLNNNNNNIDSELLKSNEITTTLSKNDQSDKVSIVSDLVSINPENEFNTICIKEEKDLEFKVVIDPKEAIEEVLERNEKKRVVNVEKYSQEFKCQELYNWFHLMFQEWEKEIDGLPCEIKSEQEGRDKLGIYKQCRGYIKPLLRLLKRKEVTKIIMNKLFEVMVFCLDHDYVRAHNKYIELAIGNAPWPMGVTMVGIHERSGRSKIYTSQVAHILNDDNTKKYLLSVKRIMSLAQRLYPTSPSNQVVS